MGFDSIKIFVYRIDDCLKSLSYSFTSNIEYIQKHEAHPKTPGALNIKVLRLKVDRLVLDVTDSSDHQNISFQIL